MAAASDDPWGSWWSKPVVSQYYDHWNWSGNGYGHGDDNGGSKGGDKGGEKGGGMGGGMGYGNGYGNGYGKGGVKGKGKNYVGTYEPVPGDQLYFHESKDHAFYDFSQRARKLMLSIIRSTWRLLLLSIRCARTALTQITRGTGDARISLSLSPSSAAAAT